MKSTRVQETIQRSLSSIQANFSLLDAIAQEVQKHKGRLFLAGGAVRDIFLGLQPKDLDIEVFGLSLQSLEVILKNYGQVRTVGKSFGVLRIDGVDVDWSIPRKDSSGRFPEVSFDPELNIEDACRRRDLTMNAMLINLVTGELHDPFNGYQDMQNGILRAPDTQFFVQDPLRFYRVMQFIGRFEMAPDEALNRVCATMDIATVSQERIHQEFEKLFLRSKRPSQALQWLDDIGRLQEILPELYATKGVKQNPDYHPEGDVFEHTKQAVDGACQRQYATDHERMVMALACLCHDLGKVSTTRIVDGILRSYGHDIAGVPLADQLVQRISGKNVLRKPIARLVRYHMVPVSMVKNNAGPGAYKKLARNLAPASSIRQLALLAELDKSARNPERGKPLEVCPEPLLNEFFAQAQKYGVLDAPEKPLLTGSDFLKEVTEGPALGVLLERAYELQLEKGVSDKQQLKAMVLKNRP